MIDDDMVTIPELRVPRAELAEWQRTNNGMRQAWEKTLNRSLPVQRVHTRICLHMMDVDTTRPIQVGDVVTYEVNGDGYVFGVDGDRLAIRRLATGHCFVAPRYLCTLDEEAGR